MNGIHDLGGMHGFGPIEREADEPLFHADWEARVCAFEELLFDGDLNMPLDAFRFGIERMAPADYLRASYYERWLATIEYNLVHEGYLASDELDARVELLRGQPDAPPRQAPIPARPAPREHPESPPPAPRFAVGDLVVARNVHPTGHTRLPRYARGKRGIVQIVHGPQIFPDTNAQKLGEEPQVVYNVRFDARELWGDSAEPRQTVAIDLWESYLDPA